MRPSGRVRESAQSLTATGGLDSDSPPLECQSQVSNPGASQGDLVEGGTSSAPGTSFGELRRTDAVTTCSYQTTYSDCSQQFGKKLGISIHRRRNSPDTLGTAETGSAGVTWRFSPVTAWLTDRHVVPASRLLVLSRELARLADRLQIDGFVQIEALLEQRFE